MSGTTIQYIHGFAGGALIGLAAALFVLGLGRVAGISGIVGGLLSSAARDLVWRGPFVIGLIAGPFALAALGGTIPPVDLTASLPVLVVAGLLVGFGTRLGNGCTSGHGVCGLARLSRRSIAATATFFGFAVATVFVMRHLMGA